MKTSNYSLGKIFKRSMTIGLAAMMIVSCGKSKNKVDPNATAVANPFGYGTPEQTNYINQVKAQTGCPKGGRLQDISFTISSPQFNQNAMTGTLTQLPPGGVVPGTVISSYAGMDVVTKDIIVVTQKTGGYQLTASLCTDPALFTAYQHVNNFYLAHPNLAQGGPLVLNTSLGCPIGRLDYGILAFNTIGLPGQPIWAAVSALPNCN